MNKKPKKNMRLCNGMDPELGYGDWGWTNENQLTLLAGLETLPKRGGGLISLGLLQGLDMACLLKADSVVLADIEPRTVQLNETTTNIIWDCKTVKEVLPKLSKYLEQSHDAFQVERFKHMLDGTDSAGGRYKFGWATNEEDFEYIKGLLAKDKFAVVHADISAPETMAVVKTFFDKHNVKMEFAYLSNANEAVLGNETKPGSRSLTVVHALEAAGGYDGTCIIRSDGSTNPEVIKNQRRFANRTPEQCIAIAEETKAYRLLRYGNALQLLPEDAYPFKKGLYYAWEFFIQELKAYRDHISKTITES